MSDTEDGRKAMVSYLQGEIRAEEKKLSRLRRALSDATRQGDTAERNKLVKAIARCEGRIKDRKDSIAKLQ